MVNVLVAPDKFKGSLTALEVCNAVSEFLVNSRCNVSSLPLADGGEGTFEILQKHYGGVSQEVVVHDPMMRAIKATYGVSADGSTALIEMAKASGLQLLNKSECNPLVTTTYGTGELILHALDKRVKTIILGIGGSATHDVGTGMAAAIGFRFFTRLQKLISCPCGASLHEIDMIDPTGCHPAVKWAKCIVLCDVKNPLTGKNGSALVFAPQKGASPADVDTLELGTRHFAKVLKSQFNFSTDFPGAGAAGGLGAGAACFLKAELHTGMDFIGGITSLEQRISESDIVITGEGKLDRQSFSGKVVQRVTALARKHNKRLIVICGVSELSPEELHHSGIDECLVLSSGRELQYAIDNAAALIKERLGKSMVLQAINIS
ncbi:MAG TPA: glycerate kinase [Chryseosolibacter sp.]